MIAAIYARKSTEQNGVADEARSVVRQVEHATAYAVKKGWTVAEDHIYVDDGISGAEFSKRPGYLRLMNALKPQAPFQVLIMSEESRLGREQIETAYALKQLVMAGVRVFFYLEDKERTLDSPMEKVMLALENFAAEMEREKAAQRTHDVMRQKAQAGYVTGGRVFGYDNVEILGPPDADGRTRRSHVEWRINDTEAEVVRQIFRLYAHGKGFPSIAKVLNEAGAACPRPRPGVGKPSGWAPSSIREILLRRRYLGELVWNRTKKRTRWGQRRHQRRPETEWLTIPAPHLRIVTDQEWQDAHERLQATRASYLRGTNGKLWGRPTSGMESKYLLTGLAQCADCGGSLYVRSRSHGARRAFFYGCTSYHLRGHAVCGNHMELPLEEVDRHVLATIERDLLQPDVIRDAVQQALTLMRPSEEAAKAQREKLIHALSTVEGQLARLTTAIELGGDLQPLLTAMQERERERASIQDQVAQLDGLSHIQTLDVRRLRRDLEARLTDWQGLLTRHIPQARQILRKLLAGRLRFTYDAETRDCEFTGQGVLDPILAGVVGAKTMASPTGFEPVLPA